jgi:SAM-dependent methyltransferase
MAHFSIESLKKTTPWFVKIPAKIILSRLPIGPQVWQRLNLFRAGTMDAPSQAFAIFRKHMNAGGLTNFSGRTVLELGPGNSTLTALFARAFGAIGTWLIDANELTSQETTLFDEAEQMLAELGFPVPAISKAGSLNDILKDLNAVYLTKGLESLASVPTEEIDFLFSHAVLEHIRLADFAKTAQEMRRVLKPWGVASHQIDFRDHLQNGLHNLRFSPRVWESEFMARSGFYTNRITWPAMKQLFQDAGFSVELQSLEYWAGGLPTPQRRMALPFREMTADELMTMGVHTLLRPRATLG